MATQQWTNDALDTVGRTMRAAGFQPLGHRRDGREIWPVFGGDESDDAAAQAAAKAAADAATAEAARAAAAAKAAAENRGFPEGTALEQMTSEQQAAYWKYHSRKHEDEAKAYRGLGMTADEIKDLKARADKQAYDLSTEHEKKVADAKKEADAAARAETMPEVISAKLEAAAARAGVSEEDLAKVLQFADTSKLLGTDGKVDTDKVKAFIDTIAPATGNQQLRHGPSTRGHGNSSSSSGSGKTKAGSVAEVMAERRAARAAKATTH